MKGDFQKLRLCSLGRQGRCAPDTMGVKGIHGNWVAHLAASKYICPYSKGYRVHGTGSIVSVVVMSDFFVGSVWALGTYLGCHHFCIEGLSFHLEIRSSDPCQSLANSSAVPLPLFEFIPSLQAAVSNLTYIVKPTV